MTGHVETQPSAPVETRSLVFISHRHDDRALADVVAGFVRSRSAGRVEVYQSSDALSEGPKAGSFLSEELQEALWRAGRVILVFTRKDADWGWCLFECGLALQPNSPPTRLTVFTCDATAPPQLAGRVHVKIRDRGDVQRFTNDFLTDPDFFPGVVGPVAPGFQPNDHNVLSAATSLFEDLDRIPDPEIEDVQDWPAYPFLQLEVTAEARQRLCAQGARDDRLQTAREVVRAARITDTDSEGARIFGRRREIQSDILFGDLVDGWSETYDDAAPAWLDTLATQVMDGAQWSWPRLRWVLMQSVDARDGALYGPTVTRVRRWPDGRMQFDVEFQPFELEQGGGRVKIELPSSLAQDEPPPDLN